MKVEIEEQCQFVFNGIIGLSVLEINLNYIEQNLNTPTGSSVNSKLKVNVRSSTWQKYFKNQLFKYWGVKCVLTDVQNKDLLIGAHIKPWSKCDDKEKIDVFNGLPLSPNADKIPLRRRRIKDLATELPIFLVTIIPNL